MTKFVQGKFLERLLEMLLKSKGLIVLIYVNYLYIISDP